MKLKENLVLRQVADAWVVLPLYSENLDFNTMLTLNETGSLLWRELEKGADRQALVIALTAEYDVDRATAQEDVDAFLRRLEIAGCVRNCPE